MSEGRLDTNNKDMLTKRVMWLLTRHLVVQPCPLTADELAVIYDAALGEVSESCQNLYRAAKAMASYQSVASLPLYKPSMTGLPIELSTGHRLTLQLDGLLLWNTGYPVLAGPSSLPAFLFVAKVPLPIDKVLEFEAWSLRAAETMGKVMQSMDTAEKLICMANTAGQLDRMCPEFLRYINDDKRKHASAQIRRSPYPDGWDNVNRAHIRAMVNHLGVCSLAAEGQTRTDVSVMDVSTSIHWAFDYHTRGWVQTAAQVGKYIYEQLSEYDPIADTWTLS